MQEPIILLTGATGFLGTHIARQLLTQTQANMIALVRASSAAEATKRLLREWWDWPALRAAIGHRVTALPGDITDPSLGLTSLEYQSLVDRLTHIIHAAADVRLFAELDDLRRINVSGTQHVLALARETNAHHPLQRFSHISTAYVAGSRSGPVAEVELSDAFGFSSPYERSKFEAEQLVRQVANLPATILRPGMIVGDSYSGAVKNFNTIYFPMRLYLTGKLQVAPARPSFRVDFVPVDYVAESVVRLTFHPAAAGKTFHLTPPVHAMPTLREVAATMSAWAKGSMGLSLPSPVFLPVGFLEKFFLTPLMRKFSQKLTTPDLPSLIRLLPYFSKQPVFLRTNSDRFLGPYPHRWQELLPLLLQYAVRHSFWQHSSRTVYEQVLFRLHSIRKPITYHDLIPDEQDVDRVREVIRPAAELRQEILMTAAALRALGIRSGDRIAILGPNSTRYFTTLVAAGLVGAVSVPIYPTLPPAEITTLLETAQVRLFFVGTQSVLDRIGQIPFNQPVISFCRQSLTNVPPNRQILNWQAFLHQQSDSQSVQTAVSLDEPAAMFFTSGTTGFSKAVVYRHEQLRWLAETLASMYPWRERNRWGSYMSYLPMSHIVEGLLGNYSPYYVPAALDIYFLADFQQLPAALKIAQPTIFFSVPRFFEKVRALFIQNGLARLYLSMGDTPLRPLLGKLLRRGLLRKTGLSSCRQILVGSAASTPELLSFFQQLGIEVHNAYGLTEAPLVSLNRLGHNRIDSVGELLPETQVRLGSDGEIQVFGPQVAAGYVEGEQALPFPDGWFSTGDLGKKTPEGYLILQGRKRDILITAYGENVFPQPVEANLRSIPGVAEVLVVGDNKPYCSALFWVEDGSWSQDLQQSLERGVQEINTALPKPARVRRWAVIRGSLTVENGALTGSMKVKRAYVTKKMAQTIDAIYQNQQAPEIIYCCTNASR